jgi:hypothetical protein
MRFVQGRWRVRLRSILASTALGVLPACGPDESLEPAVHGDVCGELGPVRILELDGDRTPFSVAEFANVEDRRVLRASYPEETQDGDLPAVGRNELWSVGQCGESPLRLGDDAPFGGIEAWPDVLLTCRPSTGEIRTLDPWGERAPNVVFDLPDCSALRTHWGLIVVEPIDDDTGVLVLWSHPEDPWTETATSTVLLDSIRIRATCIRHHARRRSRASLADRRQCGDRGQQRP